MAPWKRGHAAAAAGDAEDEGPAFLARSTDGAFRSVVLPDPASGSSSAPSGSSSAGQHQCPGGHTQPVAGCCTFKGMGVKHFKFVPEPGDATGLRLRKIMDKHNQKEVERKATEEKAELKVAEVSGGDHLLLTEEAESKQKGKWEVTTGPRTGKPYFFQSDDTSITVGGAT